MSQSAKMGLFGSKDGNTESTNEDKNVASASKENSPERYAPYSIDSDSETYDTEALSIMDINDIIGVQSDAPGDSTLESEFAALSEIITGTKDEILPQTENSARDKAGTSEREANPKDWATTGMASMSKSLQLIGEAYTSDDSQESTVDEVAPCSEKKPSTFSESLGSTEKVETSDKPLENLPKNEIKSSAVDIDKKIIVETKDDLEIEAESLECDKELSEAAESPKLGKSVDLTDSSLPENSEEPVDSKIESMDVDSLLMSDIPLEETEHDKGKIEEIVEEKDPTIDIVEKEEAMEVDEPKVEILSKIEENSPSVQEKSVEDNEEALKSPEIENSILLGDIVDAQPEETEIEKAIEEDLEKLVKSAEEPGTIENLSSPVPEKQDSQESEENEPEPEPAKHKEELEEPSAMETDELLEESILEEVVLPEIPSQSVEESIPEKSEEKIEKIEEKLEKSEEKPEKTEETSLLLEKEVEAEKISLDAEEVAEVKEDFLVEREEVIESMEIDENVEEENQPESSEKLSEIHQEKEISEQPETKEESVKTPSELTTADSEIVETIAETSVATPEDSPEKFVLPTPQSSEKSSEIIQELPTESFADITLKDSSRGDIESVDEKMEVDSSTERGNKESEVDSPAQEIEKFSNQENIAENTTKEECSVDTVDEAQIVPPDVVELKEIVETPVNIPEKISNSESQEIAETCVNVLDKISSSEIQEIFSEETCEKTEYKNEEEPISEAECEIECKAIVETEKTEVPEELSEKNEEEVETDFVLAENSQSSIEDKKKIEEPEESETIDEKLPEKPETENEEKEALIFTKKDEPSSIIEGVEESPKIEEHKEETQKAKEETECLLSIEEDDKKVSIETDEPSFEKEKETLLVTEESTISNENSTLISSEKIESSAEILQEIEAVLSPKEIENDGPKDGETSTAIGEEFEIPPTIEEAINSELEQDEYPLSKTEALISSTIPIEQDIEEDPVEMNLTLDPEILESPESPDEEVNRIGGSSPERMTVDDEEEMEDNVDINLSLDPEEKEDCVDDKVDEEPEVENLGKSVDDQDENSKDILSVTRVTEMFHDDEQSQTTQEMMESILETDTGNINKILDDEEASDALECAREKLPNESDELLNKELEDPISSQNIDSLEGLLDLDLMPENEEAALKAVEPIVEKVMKASLLMEDNDPRETYDSEIVEKIVKNENEIMIEKSSLQESSTSQLEDTSGLTENDLEAFDLTSVVANPLESIDPTDETKLDLDEDILCEIADERKLKLSENLLLSSAIDEEVKIELTQQLLIENSVDEEKIILPEDLLLSSSSIEDRAKIDLADEVFLTEPDESVANMELSEDLSLESAVRDDVLSEVAAEIENLPPSSEISELESAVKFLQESEEQDIDSPLVLSPKLVESVVDEIAKNSEVGIFSTDGEICEDPTELATELDAILPDPIAISEAEIISEAAKLENEKKEKLSEETKLPIVRNELVENIFHTTPPIRDTRETLEVSKHTETPKTHREPREIISKNFEGAKIEYETLKKSAPIPKISLLEERLKIPPKIEIPQGEISRIGDVRTTPKTSCLLIQRDAKISSFQKMLDSPKSMEKGELRIVDGPKKDNERQHDFENVGSPRIILKIAKSAIADCSEPRSPKSPKIRSATNSPNPEDSPGQKLGKIKLKLSKGGHPSIIPNDNVEELCGQWHTEGSSSLSPLGMKIKFSKIADSSTVEKHDEEPREQPKHKFEEAKRTESPIGMKIKLSRTGEPSIVQQDGKDNATKHKEKMEIIQQGSPKRTESPIGMKIKLSKSGDASIIQPDKQDSMDDHKEGSSRTKDKLDTDRNEMPRRTESPLGMKFKLFKTGDASIVQPESPDDSQQEITTKRTDSPLGMKIKLSKNRGSASIVSSEISDDTKEKLEISEVPRRTESPLGMKIKLSKTGDASIIHSEESRESTRQRTDVGTQETTAEVTLGVKIKVGKSSDASIVQPKVETETGSHKRPDPTIGMKIKLSKSGDASIVHPERDEHVEELRGKERSENLQENRKIDSSIGMKIKLSKSGDASIIQSQTSKKIDDQSSSGEIHEPENQRGDAVMAMKIKLQKSGDGTIVDSDKKEKSLRRKETEMPLEMKIKLSKTGHPTIVACDSYGETSQRGKESTLENSPSAHTGKHKEQSSLKESTGMKMLKSMQNAGLHRSELTIEPIQSASRKATIAEETSKRKEITISPVESKKAKLEATLSQMLPEVTIQPVKPREKKQMVLDAKTASISRQQMNVITQEISITQVRTSKPIDLTMTDKLKSMLAKKTTPIQECQIIEHRPELIIVNENSNSSQDVMIIEEVPALRGPESKIPKKRGRPRRNPLPLILGKPVSVAEPMEPILQRDPLALDDLAQMTSNSVPQNFLPKETENRGRPKRTCRSQKSYAPPRRGRGRGGRGKRKMDMEIELSKRPRIDQDLEMIERSTTSLISMHDQPMDVSHATSELYKALRQPTMDRKMPNAMARVEVEQAVNDRRNDPDLMTKDHLESLMDARLKSHLDSVISTTIDKATNDETLVSDEKIPPLDGTCRSESEISINSATDDMQKSDLSIGDDKIIEKGIDDSKDIKDSSSVADHQNWLTPSSKKLLDGRNEGNISNVQVIDEETRMSAESNSRSQTPARNMTVQAPETIVNEESQGSVLSTATTESEKVKVKIRRMEITLDPDEGPFTVDKVAEYDWPPDPLRKGETFMIQEQISQFLGVKSFKRKYPDLKRRMVDMEERNFLRENGLVSEAMCDMGLTAVSSSEVLDVMCSDFPEQYEEYRKYIREKQMKEHSKKQKELTAAANAEKNRIDLAEMAVQSALSWNVGLNKARRESRKCSLDLQTFTIHVPKKQQKIEEEDRGNHYPVALIPGQYTDYYREYTPAELRYYPLNTVLYGPMRPNERKFDSQSEGSQSDSDSDSSSDDSSSSSSSEGTQDTEASQSTMDDVDAELSRQKEDIKSIKCKMCLKHLNKFSRTEVLIQCGTCNGYVHPSCIDLTLDMVPHIQAYAWQCTDCKTCAQCHDPADEDKMLFCDMCDRGYHIYCVGLRRVPQGRWHCQECAVCASCGSREAGGANSDRNSVAQWQHEYKKGDKNTRVYVSTLCVPCSKLWRKGRYCPHCSRCHTVPRLDLEANLVHCSACDKYLHLGCVETKDLTIDRKNYLCDFCQPLRHHMVKPLVSKVFRT